MKKERKNSGVEELELSLSQYSWKTNDAENYISYLVEKRRFKTIVVDEYKTSVTANTHREALQIPNQVRLSIV